MNVIIIPVVSNLALTQACVASCLAQDIGDVWLYIIDNASRDGTGEWLRTLGLHTTVVSNRDPQGLHEVWNEALTLAFDTLRLDYALVINNDVILRTDTYRRLRDDGGLFVTGVGVGSLKEMESCDPNARSPHPSFSCFLMRKACWERTGSFDENMYVYAGDGDYHLRMDALGIDAYAIGLPFGHEVSATIKYAEPAERDRLCKIADNDRATFERKWGCPMSSEAYYQKFRRSHTPTGGVDGTKVT